MVNSNFIQEAIFKAVDVIVEKRLKTLQVNYCIAGIISGKEPQTDDFGEKFYFVNYQDMLIKAYPIAEGQNQIYKEGDLVYTLVINGDLSKKRIILCKA